MLFSGVVYYFTRDKSTIYKIIFWSIFVGIGIWLSPLFLESEIIREKYEVYTDMSSWGEIYTGMAWWILMDRYLIAFFALFSLLYLRTKHITDVPSKQLLYFLFLFLVSLLPLMTSIVAFDRFSRFISLLTLLFIVRMLYTSRTLPNWFLNLGIGVYAYHALASFYVRLLSWDLSLFYNNLLSILYNANLTTVILK